MKKPLKIVLFDGSFKTTSFINRLAGGLSKEHHVFILGFSDDRAKRLPNVSYISLGSNYNAFNLLITSLKFAFQTSITHVLKTLSLFLSSKKRLLQEQNLLLFLNKSQPDVIHLQWPSTVPFFEKVLVENKIPVVLSQRGYQNNVRALVDSTNNTFLKKWYPRFAGFHSVSEAMKTTGDMIYTSEEKIDHVIYTGIDTDKFQLKTLEESKEKLAIISVGRPHWIKGYDFALKACKILKEQGVDFKYKILGAAGNEELLHLIREYKLESEVVLEAIQEQSAVFTKIQNADVLLMSSLHEGIANVVVEAMALGTPVISTQCGGMAELIEHQKEGWLVPTRDPKAMASELMRFTSKSNDVLVSIQKAARNKVEAQFNISQMIFGFEQLYQRVIR